MQSWLCWRFGEEGRRGGGQPSQQRKNKELQLILRQVFPKFLDFATAAAVRQLTARILANFSFFLSFFLIDWWLPYNTGLISAIHQPELAIGVPMSLPLVLFPCSVLKCPGKANSSSCSLMVYPVLSDYSFQIQCQSCFMLDESQLLIFWTMGQSSVLAPQKASRKPIRSLPGYCLLKNLKWWFLLVMEVLKEVTGKWAK